MRRSTLSQLLTGFCLLAFCSAAIVGAQEQANEIVCASTTGCTAAFIPLFHTSGGSASLANSLLSQSGTTVTLNANEIVKGQIAASGVITAAGASLSGNLSFNGNLYMANSSATAGNLYKGGGLFLHNAGAGSNAFLGMSAGNLTMTGNNNTGIGSYALHSATTGCCNTATGNNSLLQNTTGGGNTASGDGALYSNSTGGANTAIGRWALISNSTGGYNTAIGVSALQNNTGPNGITGSASYNTASGYQALLSNLTGGYNTADGYQALFSNQDGYFNTANGYGALGLNVHGGNNTASGYSALGLNTSGTANAAYGWYALGTSTGANNTAIGALSLSQNGPGTYNTAVGYGADVPSGSDLTNATAIGSGAIVNASNKIRLGNGAVTVVEGPPYSVVSDRSKKENFKAIDAEEVLRKVRDLSVMSWNYIGHDPAVRHYGPVAQDFFAAFGHDGAGTVGTPTTISSTDLDGVLLLAVQALEKRVEELSTLKAENADLKARLEKLEAHGARLVARGE